MLIPPPLEYDGNNNVTKEINPASEITIFKYDNLNRLSKKTLPDNIYEYDYDISSNITQIKNLTTQIDFTYTEVNGEDVVSAVDSSGLGEKSYLPGESIEYDYDVNGNRTFGVVHGMVLNSRGIILLQSPRK